jgi:hypothetical protein
MKKQPHYFIGIFALIAVICAAIVFYSKSAVVTKSSVKEGEKIATLKDSTNAENFKELREIRIERASDKEEKVTFVLNGFYPPKTSVSEEETPKIVCDFPETRMSEGVKPTIEVNGTYLKRIRLEIHEGQPSKLIAVLDMTPNLSYSIKQTFFKKENYYTLTLKEDR